MKYWYLKGAEIYGPLPVEDIVKDEGFSAETFVCPEPESENSESWKPASHYKEDFGRFLGIADNLKSSEEAEQRTPPYGAEEDLSLKEERNKEEESAADFLQKNGLSEEAHFSEPGEAPRAAEYNVYTERLKLSDLPPVSENEMEETIHARSPLNAAMDDNLLDEIPASAVLTTKEEEQIKQNLEEPSLEKREEEAKMLFNEEETLLREEESLPKKIFQAKEEEEKPAAVSERASEDASGLSAPASAPEKPVSGEADEAPGSAPAETFTASASVVHIDPDKERTFREKLSEQIKRGEDPADYAAGGRNPLSEPEEEVLSENDDKDYGGRTVPNHGAITENHEEQSALISVQDSVNSQFVKPAPTTTGHIISSSDGRVRSAKEKRNDLIYIMVMSMVVLVIVALMMMFTSDQSKNASQDKAQARQADSNALSMDDQLSRSVIQGIDEGVASPEIDSAGQPLNNPGLTLSGSTVKDGANDAASYCENIVKNYKLPDGKTIEEYFNKMYASPYQTRWGSNLLHGNTYVVEFFASKVRSEPIRYMFSVNAGSGEIGGMNNAAVDLVGK